MKADLSRRTFYPLKHFARVVIQQGRVQLDADWNEQTAILLHYLRSLAADLIGPHGSSDDGFTISPLTVGATSSPVAGDFVIGAGHYYVGGILCEADSRPIPITRFFDDNKKVQVLYWPLGDLAFHKGQYVEVSDGNAIPAVLAKITNLDAAGRTLTLDADVSSFNQQNAKPRVRHLITYLTQPDYPVPDKEKLTKGQSYGVYLDVWERLITYVEDDGIREVALGGPDTAARSKVVWQVRAAGALEQANCSEVETLIEKLQGPNRGWLKAMAKQDSKSTDPCIISPDARYRGPENQLYRVEIHRPGSAGGVIEDPLTTTAATFKWSRENGSAIYPIVSLSSEGETATVTLETLGRDDRFGLAEGVWVEIVDDDYVLQNRYENLLKIHAIDRPNMTVTLEGTTISNVGRDSIKHPLLRRWDHKEGDPDEGGLQLSGGAALIIEGKWLELEDGVKIQFQKPDNDSFKNEYRTGDYWLIPARTATGEVEWPREYDSQGQLIPIAKAPDGIIHYYAPLAVINVNGNGEISLVGGPCRISFTPMRGLREGGGKLLREPPRPRTTRRHR
jgi:hypothetical protein